MARIQILELPTEHHGDDTTTPFLLILDQVDDVGSIRKSMDGAKELSGARGILAFEETIEIPGNYVSIDDGHTVHLKVEPDLSAFAPAVEAAIADAQRRLGEALTAAQAET